MQSEASDENEVLPYLFIDFRHSCLSHTSDHNVLFHLVISLYSDLEEYNTKAVSTLPYLTRRGGGREEKHVSLQVTG